MTAQSRKGMILMMIKVTSGNVTAGVKTPAPKPFAAKPSETKTPAPNMDKVTISSVEAMPDAKFIEALKESILKEVRDGADIHKLGGLKAQVDSGEYDVNPQDTARKLLMLV